MKTTLYIGLAAAIWMAGCAAKPEKIKAAVISDVPYRQLSCEELAAERDKVAVALAEACRQQRKARGNDTIGVIFVGVPVGSLCGDNVAADIRRLKGELATIEQVASDKGCRLPEIRDPVAKTTKAK